MKQLRETQPTYDPDVTEAPRRNVLRADNVEGVPVSGSEQTENIVSRVSQSLEGAISR